MTLQQPRLIERIIPPQPRMETKAPEKKPRSRYTQQKPEQQKLATA